MLNSLLYIVLKKACTKKVRATYNILNYVKLILMNLIFIVDIMGENEYT